MHKQTLNMKNHSIRIDQQSGFTLLEILVTVIILAIGLLGIASLQSTSIKLSYDAYLRSQAALLSYDLMDRVRSNPNESYSFDTITSGSIPSGDPTACISVSTDCSPTAIASADMVAWFEQASSVFADGKFSLRQTPTSTATMRQYEIKINWQDRYEVEDAQGSVDQADNPSVNNNRAEFVFFFDVRQST